MSGGAGWLCSAPVNGEDKETTTKRASASLDSLACTVVVDGAPVVEDDRRAKLLQALVKFASKRGVALTEEMIEMPADEGGKSKG